MPKVLTRKQLAQRNLTTTGDSLVYSNYSAAQTTWVKTIIVCNLTANALTYSLYVNQNGQQTGDAFAILKNIPLAAHASDQRIYPSDAAIYLVGANATVMANCSAANSMTITLYGIEELDS